MHETELIAGLRKGDRDAFKKLIELHQVPLIRVCKGFLHHEEDARDIVQDTFVEVFESIHHFREDARLSTWLYRIAVNKSLNLIRKNKTNRLLRSLDLVNALRHGAKQPDDEHVVEQPGMQMEKRERAKLIRQAVDSLPENQRIAFVLNKYQDLSYKEIADVMAITLSAVESLLHRAKLGLQRKLHALHKKNML
jgi:RNA polymerase sigma-70 factor (ECF subfamily)